MSSAHVSAFPCDFEGKAKSFGKNGTDLPHEKTQSVAAQSP
jgi:hypothetical protein